MSRATSWVPRWGSSVSSVIAHSAATAAAAASSSACSSSESGSGSAAWRRPTSAPQRSEVDAPTPRGSQLTRSNRSARVSLTGSNDRNSSPDPPGPPGLSSSEPMGSPARGSDPAPVGSTLRRGRPSPAAPRGSRSAPHGGVRSGPAKRCGDPVSGNPDRGDPRWRVPLRGSGGRTESARVDPEGVLAAAATDRQRQRRDQQSADTYCWSDRSGASLEGDWHTCRLGPARTGRTALRAFTVICRVTAVARPQPSVTVRVTS